MTPRNGLLCVILISAGLLGAILISAALLCAILISAGLLCVILISAALLCAILISAGLQPGGGAVSPPNRCRNRINGFPGRQTVETVASRGGFGRTPR
ncbi:MAG TPA: hypothetical protein VM492_02455 [Sumerlaeia bacterium]|nr:hypothetical protein [Sumerlaeia bacterium]